MGRAESSAEIWEGRDDTMLNIETYIQSMP